MPKSLFVLMSPENQAAYQKGRAAGQASVWSGEGSEEWATGLGFLAGRAYAKDHPEQAPKVVEEAKAKAKAEAEAADETPMPASRPAVPPPLPPDAEAEAETPTAPVIPLSWPVVQVYSTVSL